MTIEKTDKNGKKPIGRLSTRLSGMGNRTSMAGNDTNRSWANKSGIKPDKEYINTVQKKYKNILNNQTTFNAKVIKQRKSTFSSTV
jgi:hypothetical protein